MGTIQGTRAHGDDFPFSCLQTPDQWCSLKSPSSYEQDAILDFFGAAIKAQEALQHHSHMRHLERLITALSGEPPGEGCRGSGLLREAAGGRGGGLYG